jgi:hypothetical protein
MLKDKVSLKNHNAFDVDSTLVGLSATKFVLDSVNNELINREVKVLGPKLAIKFFKDVELLTFQQHAAKPDYLKMLKSKGKEATCSLQDRHALSKVAITDRPNHQSVFNFT